ncbi:hypothetical protein XIS1_1440011 [Xenorhabdus innexi]|uniref:Uncharacterized protein n=1 Tax=Xenorhabdus innexi TaxID=290109 RepID=A0A1N6MUC2_9GAMM|nr:hypothetical protein XIS1_1440011 [Xenorhabdus innexi]
MRSLSSTEDCDRAITLKKGGAGQIPASLASGDRPLGAFFMPAKNEI